MKRETGSTREEGSVTRSWAVAEALAAHQEKGPACAPTGDLGVEERAELESLLQVADRLERRMVPLRPSTRFVESLRHELVEEAGRRMVKREKRHRLAVISAAVAGGIVSLASLVGGIVVLVKWLRTRGEARQASTA